MDAIHFLGEEETGKGMGKPKDSGLFHIDAQAFYDAIVKSTDDYIYIIDMKAGDSLVSENMWRDFALPGRIFPDLISSWGALVHDKDQERYFSSLDELIQGRTDEHNMEYQVRNRKGEYVWVVCRGRLSRDESGAPVMFAGVVTLLASKGKVDLITGLLTQAECERRVGLMMDQDGSAGGILLLGMDDFKCINSLKDHIFGDSVLRQFAQNAQQLLPPKAGIYRFDGDQFAIVYPDGAERELLDLYQSIHLYANREHEIDGISYFCSVSGGIIMMDPDGGSYQDLIKYAASALEASKKRGKNSCTVFSPDLLHSRLRSMEITNLLHKSVVNNMEHFSLVYQPFASSDKLHVKGAEALLRWWCEPYGAVPPVEFIPLLESSGLIVKAGKWVLETAVATCKKWLSWRPDFVMNINVSYLQIIEPDFVPFVMKTLEKNGLGAEHIVLELTESYFVTDTAALQEAFRKLRECNIQIAMDDFGTGYSSLGMLSQTPADIVKIDRVFISSINDQEHVFNRSFIGAVIQLCHSVGISVCVEGVELADELKAVCSLNADSIQGYFISRPIPPEQFEEKFSSPISLPL